MLSEIILSIYLRSEMEMLNDSEKQQGKKSKTAFIFLFLEIIFQNV